MNCRAEMSMKMDNNMNKDMSAKAIVPFSSVALLRKLAQKLHQQGETGDAQDLASAIASIVLATGAVSFYGNTFFGGCPACGDCEEVLYIGQKGYAVCHEHRVYWYTGVDHLAVQDEDRNAECNLLLLASYKKITVADAFSQDACSCCGLYLEHAAWCITPGPKGLVP
jgi:hypothetical protein